MSAAHNRARALENETATTLRGKRVKYRARYQRAPDVLPLALPCGVTVQPECKARKTVPKLVTDAIKQARGYTPDAVPLAVLRAPRGETIVCLPLADFARIAGLAPLDLPKQRSLDDALGDER